jgi:hypothetical protein
MSSSTSSSDIGARGLIASARLVLEAAGPACLVAVALAAAAATLLERAGVRHPPPLDIESLIVQGQRERARTIPEADLLLIGDSSALMDVDSVALGEALGRRAESLATIGFVGPAGYARLLRDYAASGRRVTTVLVLMSPVSLSLTEPEFDRRAFESMVVEPVQGCGPARAGEVIYRHLVAPTLALPLPGAYGRFYGGAAALEVALERGQGSLTDPNTWKAQPATITLRISDAVAKRLEILRRTLLELGARRVLSGLSPLPERALTDRNPKLMQALSAELARRLDAEALAGLAFSLPDERFASLTHLNAAGRSAYSKELAALLRDRGEPSVEVAGP